MASPRLPVLSGPLIIFIDAAILVGQAQFLMATDARLRQPAIVELPMTGSGPSADGDIALVSVIVAADGSLRIDADPAVVPMAELAQRLAPLRDRPGTPFLHGAPDAPWALMIAVQRTMSQTLDRDVVAPFIE